MVDPTTLSSITTPRLNKVVPISLLTIQSFTGNRNIISSIADVTNISSAAIYIHMGRTTSVAFTAGINFRIEASSQTSGDNNWVPITVFTSGLGTGVSLTNTTVAESGSNQITVAAIGNIVVGDILYINDATEANSEFARVIATAGNVITLENILTFSHAIGTTVTRLAEMYYALIDTTSFTRLRVVVDGSLTGQNFDASSDMTVGA